MKTDTFMTLYLSQENVILITYLDFDFVIPSLFTPPNTFVPLDLLIKLH